MFISGQWLWSVEYKEACKVLESATLWDREIYTVWLSGSKSVVRTQAHQLTLLSARGASALHISFVLFASRILNLLQEDVLLAPGTSSVVPLPHQLKALRRAISGDHVRFLLADEVGLGKTIEAGLVMRELKLRGMVKRILVVAPKGLITQWLAEMKTHFGEDFRHLSPSEFSSYRNIVSDQNIWKSCDQVITSLDSVKPLDARQGWSADEVKQFNRERFEDLVLAGWDLIVVDEAHRMGGSSDQVARYQLGRGLSEASPYFLLLSATPHQGKREAFHRLVALLDRTAFPVPESVTEERVRPYIIRTEKRHAVTADGLPLFKPRVTKLIGVEWSGHDDQKGLYDAVTEYVRNGYNQALREKKRHIGFLMILMQRLVTSSTRAIVATLEKRVAALKHPEQQVLSLLPSEEDWNEMDGQEQLENFVRGRTAALKNETSEVELLLVAAKRVDAHGPDAKAEALLEWIYRLQKEEEDPDLKVLIFTEFIPTQEMLVNFLEDRGISVTKLNGGMSMEERQTAQIRFKENIRVLVSTDAGGEGLNLQFCHVVINFDIPWNPMRLEQRIGRVDRIGQKFVVRALNLVLADSVEFRVREVLEEKLAIILEEFGVDKTGDVLDSAEAGELFDDLYVNALLHPESVPEAVDKIASAIKDRASDAQSQRAFLSDGIAFSPEDAEKDFVGLLNQWVQQMVESYVTDRGGNVDRELDGLLIQWPGQTEKKKFFFPGTEGLAIGAELLQIDNARIRGMLASLAQYVPEMPIPSIRLSSGPENLSGVWSLWEVAITTELNQKRKVVPIFIHDDGRVLSPTARFVWEQLCVEKWQTEDGTAKLLTTTEFEHLQETAKDVCKAVYAEMTSNHLKAMKREKEKLEFSLQSRRKLIQTIGLPEVRQFRIRQLEEEERKALEEHKRQSEVMPRLQPVLVIRISAMLKGTQEANA